MKLRPNLNRRQSNRLGIKFPIDIMLGILVILLLIFARFCGWLQPIEWKALDYGLRWRLPEATDPRITILGIDDADIQRLQSYPIPDQVLVELLQALNAYQPRTIGVDIIRDLPVPPGHQRLMTALTEIPNVTWIEAIPIRPTDAAIPAPTVLTEQQIGFANAILDRDGFLRRSLLGTHTFQGDYHLSFTIQLAASYLKLEGLSLENGIQDSLAMRFGTTELPRIQPQTGGYVRADTGGNQILLNYRSGSSPFQRVSLAEILDGNVDPDLLKDRMVLIGLTALSNKDIVNTDAIADATPGLTYGVEIQAHAISQILSAILDNRPLLKAWPDSLENLWIICWGIIGIGLGRLTQTPLRQFGAVIGISLTGLFIGGVGLMIGLWIPTAPAQIVFVLNGIAVYSFYLYDRNLKGQVQERQKVIEYTFDTIHNGPLQSLAQLARDYYAQPALSAQLQALNQDLRDVYDVVRQETLAQDQPVFRSHNRTYDLSGPFHEVLYEIFLHTLERPFPAFQDLKIKVIQFDPLDTHNIGIEERREICHFFEEALCNVGKYAQAATRLTIATGQEGQFNFISVQDNGNNPCLPIHRETHRGRGTIQGLGIARKLRGEFARYPSIPRGTVCELKWTIHRPLWSRWRK